MGLFSIEGADEFSGYGIPQQYEFDWATAPWLSGLSLQGAVTNPMANLDTMDPEARNALLNSGYDPLQAAMAYQPQYSTLDIEKYRVDPFGGYIQAQGKDGKTIYLMGTGKSLSPGVDMMTNYENAGLPVFRNPSVPNEEWRQMDYDPYGANAARKSLYKLAEPVGQGWFSQNMDWLVPLAIGGLGGGLAASGVGMGSGATAGTAAGTAGAAGAAGTVPAWAPATAGATFSTELGILPSIMEAQTLAGAGLTAAEMAQLGVAPWAAKVGSLGLPQITGPNPKTSLLDVAKKIPTSLPGGGGAQMEGGGDGGEDMSIWSDTVNPFAFDPVGAYQPQYLNIQQQQFPFEAELQKRLALIRGAR